ncbi:MAG: carbamoyltransferase C-terminal domain-containing protein [Patescibacteria group bacterium]|nr:carbamoyltransferase C-terminal domain-containing protein [Patescibacteria group bacterium]
MYILGINAYHGDSSACLIKDGKLVVALEEERIRRIKHWAGLPIKATQFCLDFAGIKFGDVDYIAVSRDPKAHLLNKIIFTLLRLPKITSVIDRLNNRRKIRGFYKELAAAFNANGQKLKNKIYNIEHHRSHLASAFFVSPYERAAVLSIDGMGDFISTMWGIGKGNKIKVFGQVKYPHSLGFLYTAITQYLGFWKYGDEYKVMGLSAFGKPIYLENMRKMIKFKHNGGFKLTLDYFIHQKKGVKMAWQGGEPILGKLYSDKLIELLGPARGKEESLTHRHENIAASVQALYEEVFFYILDNLYEKTGCDNLCFAGGTAQNSLANGKIFRNSKFKDIYIPPAGSDAGTAVGAAYYLYNQILYNPREFVMSSSFWGPEYSEENLKSQISNLKNRGNFLIEHLDDKKLIEKAAKFLADSKVVGWFQGRTEWGPRALGNRSILANPCDPKIKDILNLKIKKRESFRPFAPAILEEEVLNYFTENKPVPFMEKVFSIKPEKRKIIPAVVHADGTGRLQTVSRENNPLYYDLIKEFGRLTGVPILINTSFNENEPIVNKPEEAINCFLRTDMDVLVLGNYIVLRNTK